MQRIAAIFFLTLTAMFGFFQPTAGAQASERDALMRDLGGEDEAARARARQLLPREGIEVVPRLLPLLGHENQAVWRAAFNVLADIAGEVAVPGRETERAAVVASLITLLESEQPVPVKERGLRLLPLVIPDGYDIAAVAKLLKDPELRDKARAALELTGTAEARAALREALNGADADFQCALLNSLGQLRDAEGVADFVQLTHSEDARVRAAAARALSWTGDPHHLTVLRRVWERADPTTEFEAADAFLVLADAVARKGGNWEYAMAAYREALRRSSDPAVQGAALVGLGRFGDETVVDDILAALETAHGEALRSAALSAFEHLEGNASNRALLQAYPRFPESMQHAVLSMFGRKRDPLFFDMLAEAAASGDETIRRAALSALADSQLPAALSILQAAAESAPVDECPVLLDQLERLAESFRDRRDRDSAGAAFASLYRLADTPERQRYALEGLKQFPVPSAMSVLIDSLGSDEFARLPLTAQAGVANALFQASRTDEAEQAIAALIPRLVSAADIREVADILRAMGRGSELTRRLGFVTSWLLVGPFPWSMSDGFTETPVGEPAVDPSATYRVGDREISWRRHETQDPAGFFDLTAVFGAQSNATAYGLAEIVLPEDTDAVVRLGTDDGVKLWVNGQPAHENNVDRPSTLDQDLVPVRLQRGPNVILIQVTQIAGGWNFCLRLTRTDGTPLAFSVEGQSALER